MLWLTNSWFLLLPPLGVAVAAVCHVLIARLSRQSAEWRHLFLGVLAGGVFLWGTMIYTLLSGHAPSDFATSFALNTVSYLGLAFLYADFNNLQLSSLRVRVLRECCKSTFGLTMDELLTRYDEKKLVEKRLEKYIKQGFLVREAESYRIGKPAILWMCRCYLLLYWIIFGRSMPRPPV